MALLSICCMILLGFADDVLGKLRQSDTLKLKSNNKTKIIEILMQTSYKNIFARKLFVRLPSYILSPGTNY